MAPQDYRRRREGFDGRTVAAVVLSLAIYWVWLGVYGPASELPPELDAPEPVAVEAPVDAPAPPVPAPVPVRSDLPVEDVSWSACAAEFVGSTDGGGLARGRLLEHTEHYNVLPWWWWAVGFVTGESSWPWLPYGEPPGAQPLLLEHSRALAPGVGADGALVRMQSRADGDVLTYQGLAEGGISVEQRFSPASGDPDEPCTFIAEVTFRNGSDRAFEGPLWVGMHEELPEAAGGMMGRYQSVLRGVALMDGSALEVDRAVIDEEGPQVQEGPLGWFGLADRYFGFIAIPDDAEGDAMAFTPRVVDGVLLHGLQHVVATGLAPGATHTERYEVYVGPLDLDVIQVVRPDLGELVYFGWFAFFAYPLLWLLKGCFWALGNWGLAIIGLTVLVKGLFFPLTQSAFKSTQAMQSLQPKMQEVREKYADDADRMNRETMALLSENKVNPLGGCVPMFVQFPVWIALYNVLLNVVELYHSEFLYLRDLSEPDPYGIIPAIVVAMMLIQQRFTPTGNMDPAQARILKLMPLMFGVLFFTFPSGLVLYIFCNVSLSILQQWWIKRSYGAPATTTT
ncbi:MAG: YidC/Oxa1 family membrane protein insertase [Myxococcota bacterium]|jgi:YidC/Oxa1 family membrane protein insertase